MCFNVICASFLKKIPKTVCHTRFINDKFFVIQLPFIAKCKSYNFHLWENVCYRDFIQFSVRMELYRIV